MPTIRDRLFVTHSPIPQSDEARALRFAQMQGREEISRCFSFRLEVMSEDHDIEARELLGQHVSVEVDSPVSGDPVRHFDGVVDSFSFTGFRDRFGVYSLVLVPNFHFLSKTTDNRIFQEKSVVQIIEQIFGEYGFSNYELRLSSTYDPLTYCVQYNETDLDFVQRLMERVGIFYFFEHAQGLHTMILCDTVDSLSPAPGFEEIRYEESTTISLRDIDVITRVHRVDLAVTSDFAHTDYDFTKPSADLAAVARTGQAHSELAEFERYEYPGGYTEVGTGSDLASIRNEEDQGRAVRVRAVSNVPAPGCGSVFSLVEFPREAENDTYFIQAVTYDLSDGQYVSRPGLGDTEGFTAEYDLIPTAQPFRPERRTPSPVMRGPQTAVVVGPSGAEIHTDEYSRVKVQFFWDREGGRDENSSCWVRVSATWGGAGWGFIQIPRIGQEVIVDFLEGDPDQPIITGRVYNAEQMPPYGLPGEATKSGWKSNSSPGGGGWNELMFEDKKGEELVYFQAEKDHDELVKNNETRHIGNDWVEDVVNDATQWVGHDRRETVDNNKWTEVKVDRDVTIGQNDTERVGVNRSLSVGVDEKIEIGSNSTETIGMNHKQTVGLMQTTLVKAARSDKVGLSESRAIGASQTLTVGLKRNVRVGSKQARFVKADDTFQVGANQTTQIGKNHEVKVKGDQSFWVDGDGTYMITGPAFWNSEEDGTFKAAKNVLVEAGDELVLTCGKASIILKKDGTITVKGKDIIVDGSGEVTAKAAKDMTLKGKNIKQN
jgi:type VI secretion system secreted protein VgrG